MIIEAVDVGDDESLGRMHDLQVRAEAREYASPWTWQELAVAARTPDPWTAHDRFVVLDDDGTVVAACDLEQPLRDNTHLAYADLAILPDRLDTPLALEIVRLVLSKARTAGRRVVHTEAVWSLDADTSPKRELLEAAGFTVGIKDAHRVLDLPCDVDRLAALAQETAPAHVDYDLRTWRGSCPEAWLTAYGHLRSRMLAEAPSGELELEPEDFGPDRVRHEETELAAQQRVSITTVAVAPDMTLAGHTQLVIPGTDPDQVFQWDTLVLPEHRGHRLGLAMKVRSMQEATPDLVGRSLVHTWNAADNAPMVAVNERLGFRLVEYSGEFQCWL